MIIIAGEIDFDTAANRDRAVALSGPLQHATRREEAGCWAYCFSADPCIDTRMLVYELWADEASLADHFEHQNYFNMRAALGDCGIVAANNKKYRCDLSEPVYDDTRTPRADFFTA
ncbi:putative quinol monooxygenase [Candidatus Poriferisodalis sp.]|uniref:putative quinol monooxygenase n=1 Tax=Candidatus Poriferisodalis sp. TaxID=3101277 RepID=UPI003B0212AE